MELIFDKEGTLSNPAHDHAKLVLEIVGKKVLYEDCEPYLEAIFGDNRFDAWDDELYFTTLDPSYPPEFKHSTGTSPWPANLAAAVVGIDTKQMIGYQLRALQLNPGVDKLMRFITREKNKKPYLATNAYPAAAVKIAKDYAIPLHNVRTQGLQDLHGVASEYIDIIDVCARRVPMEFFIEKRKEVKKFLDDWIYMAQRMLPVAKARDVNGVAELMLEYMYVFHKIADKDLRVLLKEMFIPPYEIAIMGGHNKKRVVDEVADETGKKTVSFGDSIVDGQMLGGATVGVSMNCTNSHAVGMSTMNVCVVDYELLIPMVGDMISDTFDIRKVKQYETDGLRIFTKDEIMKAVVDEQTWKNSEIRAANNATKSELKQMFKKPNYA
jgi:hypothetical protein